MLTSVQLSGGFDSAAVALLELQEGWKAVGLFVDYGQVYADSERAAACRVSDLLRAKYPGEWMGLVQTSVEISTASTSDVDFYIPVRNLVLLSMSVNHALSIGAEAVSVGMHTVKPRPDDPHCFSDASISFVSRFQAAVDQCLEKGDVIEIRMPLVKNYGTMRKVDVVRYLIQNGIPWDIMWNCYSPLLVGVGDVPFRCGECLHCVELREVLVDVEQCDIPWCRDGVASVPVSERIFGTGRYVSMICTGCADRFGVPHTGGELSLDGVVEDWGEHGRG